MVRFDAAANQFELICYHLILQEMKLQLLFEQLRDYFFELFYSAFIAFDLIH
jgi:hypothetical protein